jgi:hypothetical protein
MPARAAVVVVGMRVTEVDTEGFTQARHGVTLRYRTGGTDAGWHLKRPAAPGARTEIRALRPSSSPGVCQPQSTRIVFPAIIEEL